MEVALDNREQRIRERAYRLWLEEGKPGGRAQDHWELASELVAIEESHGDATSPVEEQQAGEPVEPIEALANAGEFPTTTDQGEMNIPERESRPAPNERPLR
jgi:hypothetical protein